MPFWCRNFILWHFNFMFELKKHFWWNFNFADFRSHLWNRKIFMLQKFITRRVFQYEKWNIPIANTNKVLTKYLARSCWTSPQWFCVTMNVLKILWIYDFMNFMNVFKVFWTFQDFYLEQYITIWYTPINHEQCIFIIGRELVFNNNQN